MDGDILLRRGRAWEITVQRVPLAERALVWMQLHTMYGTMVVLQASPHQLLHVSPISHFCSWAGDHTSINYQICQGDNNMNDSGVWVK